MGKRSSCLRQRRQSISKLTRLHALPRGEIADGLLAAQIARMLHSPMLLAAYLFDILRNEMCSDDEIYEQAAEASLFEPCTEPLPWRQVPKQRGAGHRVICSPGPMLKARNRMVAEMLRTALGPVSPSFFNWKGRGCPRQAYAIKKAIEEGYSHLAIADVRACYPSVSFDAVYDLALLPPEAIRYASDYRCLNLVYTPARDKPIDQQNVSINMIDEEQIGPRGLLQGLCTSDVLWVALVRDLPEHCGSDVRVMIYCDDIVVACPTPDRAARAQEALVRYFSDHPAGQFSLHCAIHDARDAFEHTGYRFGYLDDIGEAVIGPSAANLLKLHRRIDRDIWSLSRSAEYSCVERIVRQNVAGLHAIDDDYIKEFVADGYHRLDELRGYGSAHRLQITDTLRRCFNDPLPRALAVSSRREAGPIGLIK